MTSDRLLRHAQLNLYGNDIRSKGAAAIGEALQLNGSLTSLDVRSNNIGPKGAAAFGEALKVNGSLKTVRSASAYALPSSHTERPCFVRTAASRWQRAPRGGR